MCVGEQCVWVWVGLDGVVLCELGRKYVCVSENIIGIVFDNKVPISQLSKLNLCFVHKLCAFY